MFGPSMFSTKNKTQKINFLVSLDHLSIFLIDAFNSFLQNASITQFHIRGDKTQRQQNSLKPM